MTAASSAESLPQKDDSRARSYDHTQKGSRLSTEGQDLEEKVEEQEKAQAVQAATQAGAQATQGAVQAGQAATSAASVAGLAAASVAGAVGLVVGIFLGLAIAKASRP